MTMGCWFSSLMTHAGRRAHGPSSRLLPVLDVFLELEETGPVGRMQYLATELDGDLRRITVHARQQYDLDALKDLGAGFGTLLELARDGLHETVGEQDAEESADQRAGEHLAEHRRRFADRAHDIDHPH